MKPHRIKKTIKILDEKIEERADNCFFNECAQTMDIIDFEAEFGINLPLSYIIFLESYDGGFICGKYQAKMIKENDNFEDAKWNSTTFFGLDEIREIYENKSSMNWKLFDKKYDVYPFIPFCRTSIGELIVFANPLSKGRESPVFDAFHEEFPSDWGTLFANFTELLEHYLNNDGNIPTSSYEKPTALEFVEQELKNL